MSRWPRNPVQFYRLHKAYEPGLRRRGEGATLDALRADGVCVLPGYVSPEVVAEIRRDVEPILTALSRREEAPPGVKTSSYPDFGTYVLHDVGRLSVAADRFVKDEWIADIARQYSDGRARSYGATAELRDEPCKNLLVDDLHTDTWAFRFKAMLYLTDVTAATAPLRYLRRSHTGQRWRGRKFVSHYLAQALPRSAWAHRLRATQAARQIRNPHFELMTILEPAGSVVLFDTRGVHGGSTLRHGRRLIVNHSFSEPGT